MDADGGEAFGEENIGEAGAAFKGMRPDGGHIIGDIHLSEAGAARKGIVVNRRQCDGKLDTGQPCAVLEGTTIDGRHNVVVTSDDQVAGDNDIAAVGVIPLILVGDAQGVWGDTVVIDAVNLNGIGHGAQGCAHEQYRCEYCSAQCVE